MCVIEDKIDELTPIAIYMSREMMTNAAGDDAVKIRKLNEYSPEDCIDEFQELALWIKLLGLGITPGQCIDRKLSYKAAALLIWAGKVGQNADWDHKPIISHRFNQRNPTGNQHWHLYENTLYYYDVWSNIHYGYVGLASGFSEAVLLDGAGLEQIGSTLLRGKLPTRDSSVRGLRAWDDIQDRAGIKIGMQLYAQNPANVNVNQLLNKVLLTSGIRTKRYAG